MKKSLIICAYITLALLSCTKKDGAVKKDAAIIIVKRDSISAVIDGVPESFNYKDTVRSIGTTGVYVAGTDSASGDRMTGYVVSESSLGTGTYTYPFGVNPTNVQLNYQPAGNEADYYYTYYSLPFGSQPGLVFPSTVTIISIDSTKIQGTFSGKLIATSAVRSLDTTNFKTITNGKFKLYLK